MALAFSRNWRSEPWTLAPSAVVVITLKLNPELTPPTLPVPETTTRVMSCELVNLAALSETPGCNP